MQLFNVYCSFLREKSNSTEDLTYTTNHQNGTENGGDYADDDHEDLTSWRRVSNIRRSLQFPKSNSIKIKKKIIPDEYSVSVSKIKQELENNNRLNTVMRNNNVDLEALENILNCDHKIGNKKKFFLKIYVLN